MTALTSCLFCMMPANRIIDHNAVGLVVRDAYPVSPGHTLVIPKRHFVSFFDATETERVGLMSLLSSAKIQVDAEFAPTGYNVGVNDGSSAGQTIPHLHIHLIPRFEGDTPDPRGGVRWVLPEKAKYWP